MTQPMETANDRRRHAPAFAVATEPERLAAIEMAARRARRRVLAKLAADLFHLPGRLLGHAAAPRPTRRRART